MNKTFLLSAIVGVLCFPVKAQTLPVPTPVQLQWQQMETTAFVHFSVNTYTDMEWGMAMSPLPSLIRLSWTVVNGYGLVKKRD